MSDGMKEALKKQLAESFGDYVRRAREMSIFTEDGRMFLDASAMLYGASVNMKNEIIKENGQVMKEDDPNYHRIISMAKKQARVESRIGRDIIGS